MHLLLFTSYNEKKCSWFSPANSWNKQLAHTPFPKKINTPRTTLRFIGFVAKISVLNPKLPADGQWPKETKESVTFFIQSPLIDKIKKSNRVRFFCITSRFFYLFFISFLFLYSIYLIYLSIYFRYFDILNYYFISLFLNRIKNIVDFEMDFFQ